MTTLRLADAILLGDSLKRRDPDAFLSRGGNCGCALGGAYLASGGSASKRSLYPYCVDEMWPWLTLSQRGRIGTMYTNRESIEAIAAYADSVDPTPRCEPPVQEPTLVEVRQEKVGA